MAKRLSQLIDDPERAKLAGVPRLRHVALLAIIGMVLAIVLSLKAWHALIDPPPDWDTASPRWCDEAFGAFAWLCVVAACAYYLRYRIKLAGAGVAATPRIWAARREVRFVLYVVIVGMLLQFPNAIFRTFVALHSGGSYAPPQPSAWRLFPIEGLVFPAIGLALIVFDRAEANQ